MPSAKSHWPRSFRGRLLLLYVAGMLLSGGLVMAVVMVLLEPLERYMLQHSVIERAESVARIIRFDGAGLPVGLDRSRIDEWPFASLSEEVVLRIVDPHGEVFYTTDGKRFPLAPEGLGFDPQRKGFVLQRDGVAMHAATVPLQRPDRLWYVQFAISDRIVLLLQHSIGLPALRKGIVATCLTFLVTFVIAMHLTLRRVLEPLRIASLQAQRITPQSLGDRLALGDLPSELVPLVDAFNRALERVQLGFQTQQEFLANAAHELKTPLSLIRAQVELGGQGGGKGSGSEHSRYLLQDIDRMARQVQQLLHLAEASEQRNYRIERCDPRSAILKPAISWTAWPSAARCRSRCSSTRAWDSGTPTGARSSPCSKICWRTPSSTAHRIAWCGCRCMAGGRGVRRRAGGGAGAPGQTLRALLAGCVPARRRGRAGPVDLPGDRRRPWLDHRSAQRRGGAGSARDARIGARPRPVRIQQCGRGDDGGPWDAMHSIPQVSITHCHRRYECPLACISQRPGIAACRMPGMPSAPWRFSVPDAPPGAAGSAGARQPQDLFL